MNTSAGTLMRERHMPLPERAGGRTSTTLTFATPKLRIIALPHPFSQVFSRVRFGAS